MKKICFFPGARNILVFENSGSKNTAVKIIRRSLAALRINLKDGEGKSLVVLLRQCRRSHNSVYLDSVWKVNIKFCIPSLFAALIIYFFLSPYFCLKADTLSGILLLGIFFFLLTRKLGICRRLHGVRTTFLKSLFE